MRAVSTVAIAATVLSILDSSAEAFTTPQQQHGLLISRSPSSRSTTSRCSSSTPALTSPANDPPSSAAAAAASSSEAAAMSVSSVSAAALQKKERRALIRAEGGRWAFDTKFGALNPFAIYYGLTSIALGLPWFVALCLYQVFRVVTFNKLDPQRRIPIFVTHIWGTTLLRVTGCKPVVENRDILKAFYKEKRPALFVANHNSWMDIPFLGYTIGWRNYKIISKKELGRVPILGKAIKVGGNIMVDRVDRRSQLNTLRQGIQYLKDGVHLCTYPEGTRSRTGRLTKFKNGAFKMAHKVGSPIIPISIVGAATVMPSHWMFPYRPARGVAKVVVHAPVESKDKTEQEVADAARASIVQGLPEEQRPTKADGK